MAERWEAPRIDIIKFHRYEEEFNLDEFFTGKRKQNPPCCISDPDYVVCSEDIEIAEVEIE